jgi:hypothetical protein
LRDLVIKLNDEIISNDQHVLKNIHDDIIDDILYIQDIFSLKIPKINYILTNSMFYYTILPLLSNSLISMTKPKVAISISLYILVSLCHYIKDEGFINMLIIVLFGSELSPELIKLIEEYPKSVKNYHLDWNMQKKSGSVNFTNYISNNFSEAFIRSLIFQTNTNYSEIIAIIKKYEKIDDLGSDRMFQSLLEDVLQRFNNSEIDIMTTYHSNISKATGINVGLITGDCKYDCAINIVDRTLKNKGKRNDCRENLMSYLKSKDDTLIILVSLLINTIHRKTISIELLSMVKLCKAEYMTSQNGSVDILNELFGPNIKHEVEQGENLIDFDDFSKQETHRDNTEEVDNEFVSFDNTYM